jgi:hypothetical protein
VSLALSSSTPFLQEVLDFIGQRISVLSLDMNDQRWPVWIVIVDDKRYVFEFVRLSVRLEFLGDLVSQVIENIHWV